MPGSADLVRKLLDGAAEDEFVTLAPGEAFRLDHFYNLASQ